MNFHFFDKQLLWGIGAHQVSRRAWRLSFELQPPWARVIIPPLPAPRVGGWHDTQGEGGSSQGVALIFTPARGGGPLPSALIHLRIRVPGNFFHLGQFFLPAPSAQL